MVISSSSTDLFLFNDLNAVSNSLIVSSRNSKSFSDEIKFSLKLLEVFVILFAKFGPIPIKNLLSSLAIS